MANLAIRTDKCKQCEFCVLSCPKGALSITCGSDRKNYRYIYVDSEKCIDCGICRTVCPDGVFEAGGS
jgi:2-oxoglutarate ferredoxin oxidoreductase subunit delta